MQHDTLGRKDIKHRWIARETSSIPLMAVNRTNPAIAMEEIF